MPDLDSYNQNYYHYDVLLGLVAVFKFMAMLYKIYQQQDLDIFMIDWESPKMYQHGRFAPK